ncbi:hypothetical protein P3339_06535 [Microbulbifer sp. MLAF003]|uniref:hypothetical protein n=1 Tax=Microbulbifer sp. MLAF003 TaxID=3032582 RepID=UPI0024ADB45B|nr:hypothetical protein [Microbulbifer sp. MLAF003]WHI52433.1 hypothetical protein P3339_06535 [Microbulbifer sp. MLAF003]
MRQFVFLLTSILFSILLYVLHPFFYEWNLFAALRNESHNVSLFVVSLLCVVLVAIPAAFIRSGVYAIFNACLLFTLFIPFFSLMPYYNPRYVFSEVSCFAVVISVMFSIMGVFFGLKSFKIDWCGFGYIRKTQFLFVLFLINILNICLIVFTFKDVFSFGAISNIYMQRAIYTESANVVSYFVNWQFMVFSPLLLLISMMRRRLDLIVLALIGFFVVFSITAFKVALLVPFLMVVGFVTSGLWKKGSVYTLFPLCFC